MNRLLPAIGAALLLLCARPVTPPALGAEAPDQTVTLSVVPGQMKFDINRFTVRPNTTSSRALR